jgi:signal transduction histidine kinase
VIDIQIKQAQSKGIQLLAEFNSDSGPMIYHDKERLMQVLLNLQSNAIKFT